MHEELPAGPFEHINLSGPPGETDPKITKELGNIALDVEFFMTGLPNQEADLDTDT